MRRWVLATVTGVLVVGCSGSDGPIAVLGESGVAPKGPAPSIVSPADDSVEPPLGEPVAADSPVALAQQLAATEAAIRNPATNERDLARVGWTQQVAYRALIRNPSWRAEVLAHLPPTLRPVAEANVTAGEELTRLAGTPRPELPQWRIVAPAPATALLSEYKGAEAALGVPWQYLAAIHLVETRMGRIRGTSTAGAQGPMQFIPSTWEIYGAGGDINSNHDAILAAARLLRNRGAPANMAAALYAYNPSPRYVRAVSAYAEQMRSDERAYLGYYHWQVYYGDRLLPVGYGA